MSTVIEKVHLIKSDPENNNNKFWIGELHDDGMVHCNWGRVGDTGQSKVKSGGKAFLDKKVNEKLRDGRNGEIGYRKIDIVDGSGKSTPKTSAKSVGGIDLVNIAKKQIKSLFQSKEMESIIEFLTNQNIHNITSFSGGNITYNYDTGLFQTPIGLVGQLTIDEARSVLNEIANLVAAQDYGKKLLNLHRDYCMLIPQDIGRRRIELNTFWSDISKVKMQSQVLDGLQASLATASTVKTKTSKKDVIEEIVFDTEMDILPDGKEKTRLINNYMSMRSRQHGCYDYRPIKVWSVHIAPMRKAFEAGGKKMSNIIEGYHGTGSENILSLLKTGFLVRPPSNAAISGAMFGSGCYTAPAHIPGSSTKALNYSVGYWAGRSSQRTFGFLCDVAMGRYHTPSRPYNGPPPGYDSCWAKGQHKSGVLNDECIVYKENQIDIKYLMEFAD